MKFFRKKEGRVAARAPLARAARLAPVERVAVASLKPHPQNPMTHGERNVELIKRSLQEFGQAKSIAVWRGYVVAGCGTLEAARRLGWREVLATRVDYLTEQQALAYLLMDNKSGDEHGYDSDAVAAIVQAIGQEKAERWTGLAPAEVEPLMRGADPGAPAEFPAYDENLATDHKCPKCGYEWSGDA